MKSLLKIFVILLILIMIYIMIAMLIAYLTVGAGAMSSAMVAGTATTGTSGALTWNAATVATTALAGGYTLPGTGMLLAALGGIGLSLSTAVYTVIGVTIALVLIYDKAFNASKIVAGVEKGVKSLADNVIRAPGKALNTVISGTTSSIMAGPAKWLVYGGLGFLGYKLFLEKDEKDGKDK